MVTLGFYGAAGTVTGSKYLLHGGAGRIRIDDGHLDFMQYAETSDEAWDIIARVHGHDTNTAGEQ